MKKQVLKKIFSCVCSCVMVISLSISAYAENDQLREGTNADRDMSQNVPAVEGTIDLPNNSGGVEIEKEIEKEIAPEDSNKIADKFVIEEEETSKAAERGIWQLVQEVYNGSGSLSAEDAEDLYIVQTTEDKTAFLKIVSDNPNVVVQLCQLDLSTGQIGRSDFYDRADEDGASILTNLPAGDYVLSIYSINPNEPVGDYTLMWNCANPNNPTTFINLSSDLRNVTLGYKDKDTVEVYCNGQEWLKNLHWSEHYTQSWSNGYRGRDQDIDYITVKKVHVGRYDSKKYQTNNALFVEVGKDSLWTFTQSYFQNDMGNVTHIMDIKDATGQDTPRRFTDIDVTEPLGPHIIVVDIDNAKVVDFASNYNYLRLSGETDGKVVVYRENIFGQ